MDSFCRGNGVLRILMMDDGLVEYLVVRVVHLLQKKCKTGPKSEADRGGKDSLDVQCLSVGIFPGVCMRMDRPACKRKKRQLYVC